MRRVLVMPHGYTEEEMDVWTDGRMDGRVDRDRHGLCHELPRQLLVKNSEFGSVCCREIRAACVMFKSGSLSSNM